MSEEALEALYSLCLIGMLVGFPVAGVVVAFIASEAMAHGWKPSNTWLWRTVKRIWHTAGEMLQNKEPPEPCIDQGMIKQWLGMAEEFSECGFDPRTPYATDQVDEIEDLFEYILQRALGQKCCENTSLMRVFSLYDNLLYELQRRDPHAIEEERSKITKTLEELSTTLIVYQKEQEKADRLQLSAALSAIDRFVQLRR